MVVKIFTRIAFEVLDNLTSLGMTSLQNLVVKTGESRAAIQNALEFLSMSGLAGEKYGSIYFPTEKGLALLSRTPPSPAHLKVFNQNGWPHPLTMNKVISIADSCQKRAFQLSRSKVESTCAVVPVKKPPNKKVIEVKDLLPPKGVKKTYSSTSPKSKKEPFEPDLKGAKTLHLTSIQRDLTRILLREGVLSADGVCRELELAGYSVSNKAYLLLRPLIVRGFVGFNTKRKGYELSQKGRAEILDAKGIAMDILSKLDLSYLSLRTIEIIRDQGGKNGMAIGRFENAIVRSAKMRELDFSAESIAEELSSIEARGLISRPGNGMVMLTSVCRSLIGLRPYSSLDLKRLRERGLDHFADLLVQYGEEKAHQKPKVKKSKPAKVDVSRDSVKTEVPSVDADKTKAGGDAPSSKSLSNDEIDYVNELLSEDDDVNSVSDALSAIKAIKVKLNKPELPGVKNSSDKVKLIGALVDLLSDAADAAPIISGLNDIKDDLVSNSID